MGGAEKGRWFFSLGRMVFALAAWAAGICLKLPSEAARRAGVNGLINSYYAHTTHLKVPQFLQRT